MGLEKGTIGVKRFFDHNERYSPEANELSKIARNQGISAAFDWVEQNGYSLREASHIIHSEVTECELSLVLRARRKDRPSSPPEPTV